MQFSVVRNENHNLHSSQSVEEEKDELAKQVLPECQTGGGSGGGDDNKNDHQGDNSGFYSARQKIGLFLGPILFFILYLVPTPEGMSAEAQAVMASTAWIATWWICESIPIPATSLLPVVLFPWWVN
ncbi:MAG: hypothetical protein ACLFPB_07165 [Desulfovermiculus sp.]